MIKLNTTIFLFLLFNLSINVFSQDKTNLNNQPKSNAQQKLISKGVINKKALNLISPEYPKSALPLRVSGKVTVEVIIDTAGYVSDAKVLSGHPILRKASLEAAESSRFAPFFEGKNPIKVKGLIVYNFKSPLMNWLQMGYFSPHMESIKLSLPKDFITAKSIITKLNATDTPYDPKGYDKLILAVENQLRNNEKGLWLFKLGRLINQITDNSGDNQAKTNLITEIQTHLYSKPEGVSPKLILSLETLVQLSQTNSDRFNLELDKMLNNLYILGN